MSFGYVVRAFGHAISDGGMTIQNSLGFFEVSDPEIIEVILSLKEIGRITHTRLRQKIEVLTNEASDDVLQYFVEEIGMLVEIEESLEKPVFLSDSSRLRNFGEAIFGGGATVGSTHSLKELSSLERPITLGFEGNLDTELVSKFVEKISDDTRLSVFFQVRDTVVITPNWLKSAFTPCPLCVYDFASDRVLYNPADTVLSLSDVIDILRQNGAPSIPEIPLKNDELAFALSLLPRTWEIASSEHLLRNHAIDPHEAILIDTDAKRWAGAKIPFSPLCSCIHQKRESYADGVGCNA